MIKEAFLKLKNNSKFSNFLNVALIASLAIYIFSIPSFSGIAKWNLISYAFMAISAFIVFLKYFLYEKFVFNPRLLILLVFAIEAFIGTALYSHDFRHWFTIVLLLITLVVFYYAFNVIGNKTLIFRIIAYSLFAFALYFAFHYRANILKFNLDEPLGGDFDNVNTIGTYFSLGSALFLYLALTGKKKIEWLHFIPCIAMLFLGLFTGSRHFIITTGVAFIVTVMVAFKKRKWLAALIIAGAIGLFFVIIQIPALAALKERIDRGISTLFGIGSAKYDPSAVQRFIWPQYGFNIGSRVLLFGYGAEGFSIYSGIGTYSHNTYSEIICNFGLLGCLIFYFALLYPLVLTIRSRDRSINVVYVIVSFYLVKGFFGVYFASKDAYMMIALLFYLTKDIKLGEYVGFGIRQIQHLDYYYEVNI